LIRLSTLIKQRARLQERIDKEAHKQRVKNLKKARAAQKKKKKGKK